MSDDCLSSGAMDREYFGLRTRRAELTGCFVTKDEPTSNPRTSSLDRDEDHHDAMEVDSGLSMAVDTNAGDQAPEPQQDGHLLPLNQGQSHDLSSSTTPIPTSTPASSSREPPTFDEDAERPRQRRRFHVVVEDDIDVEIRSETNAGAGGANADDETAVLESVPPRMSELSIATPPAAEQTPMLDVVQDSSVPAEPISPNPGNQSPHLNTIPLPDVPPPPLNPNAPPDPVMEAARRLTSNPDTNPDQMQADLALLAPYIAAQAMAAAFPIGGRPPPAGGTNTDNAPAEGQGQTPNEANGGPPPLPPFPFLPPFLFGGSGELPADPKRAERLANGLKVAENGLLKRWKSVCGDEGAVCAVCYGELLEEPGIEKEKENEQDKSKDEEGELKESTNEDAHEQALREMRKRRELMEKLENEEKERKLETAVLAFPCGHVFHRTCLLPWLSRHTTCPTCRFDIDPKSDTLNLPADEGVPFAMDPNGFNFRDFFSVGPILRVPRAQAPGGLFPRPARNNHDNAHEHPGPNGEPTPNAERGPAAPDGRGANNDPPSMTEMFEALFGPLLHSVGIPPPPRQPSAPRATQPASNNPATAAPTQAPAQAQAPTSEAPTPAAAAPVAPATPSAPPTPTNPPPVPPMLRRPPVPQRAAEPRRSAAEDRDRPLAMFGRLTPRRPPQPITPSWMRPPRPAPATTAPEASSAPGPSTVPQPSPSTAGPSASTESASDAVPAPATPATRESQPHGGPRNGLGQLRAMVSNLLPRRLSSGGRTSGAPSVHSTRSAESTTSASTTRNAPQPGQGPISPRTGIRAILHGPTALLRDLTTGRHSGSGNRSRASTGSATMPSLESESESDDTLSEDGAESDYDDEMPALEPIEGRRRQRESTPTPGQADAQLGNNAPEGATQAEGGANREPPSVLPAGQDMMDNIITLRIDLGHADGRDETIIVPLLFNPNGRGAAEPQAGGAPPAAQAPSPPPPRPRTPPPQKKWTPPEAVKTFRQVVEEKEREAGWRCDDPACLLGPADDEEPSDEPHAITLRYSIMRSMVPEGTARHKIQDGIRVYADGEDFRVNGENPVCEHMLHAECLVTSARVNGWGPAQNAAPNSRVTLRCPVCRLEGTVDRQAWDAGIEAEAAESN
ncbi:hypothetical protein FRC10_006932 [Ceratobasidium sp. 414]|nr:hypothetical protein FRC10_006932 [Ceratobasidium sp. 414]